VRFTLHVRSQERLIRLEARRSDRDNADFSETGCKDKLKATIICCCNSKKTDTQDQDITQSLSMQSLVQSSLYIFAYFLTYSGPILGLIMSASGIARPTWIRWQVSILWPLGGLFNILIYTRPKVSKFRRVNPQFINFPWIFIFLAVVLSGGEAPEIDGEEPFSGDLSADMRLGELESNLNRGLQLESLTSDVQRSGDTEEGNTAKPKPMRYGTPFFCHNSSGTRYRNTITDAVQHSLRHICSETRYPNINSKTSAIQHFLRKIYAGIGYNSSEYHEEE